MLGSISGALRRCVRAIWQVGGFASTQALPIAGAAVPARFADIAFAEISLADVVGVVHPLPSFEFASVADLAFVLSGATEEAVTLAPVAAVTTTQMRLSRPLAAQLAVTAARNVRKGMKSRGFAAPMPRVLKAKPVVKVAVKKQAPKRRHVWLSTQVRVVRPVANNVIALARHPRNAARPAAQKASARSLRLAA